LKCLSRKPVSVVDERASTVVLVSVVPVLVSGAVLASARE
jgi:hypothetical protein